MQSLARSRSMVIFFPGMKGMAKPSKDKNGRGLITHSVSITEHDEQPLDQALEVQR